MCPLRSVIKAYWMVQGMQNTISERTTRRTLKQMGYSSRRPHRVPLMSAKNRKLRLQFAQAHQNWTVEDWKNVAWYDESRFQISDASSASNSGKTKCRKYQDSYLNHGFISFCLTKSLFLSVICAKVLANE